MSYKPAMPNREVWMLECQMDDGTWRPAWPTQHVKKPDEKSPAPGYRYVKYVPETEVVVQNGTLVSLPSYNEPPAKWQAVYSYMDKDGKLHTRKVRGPMKVTAPKPAKKKRSKKK